MLNYEHVYKLFNVLIYKICALVKNYFNHESKLGNNIFIRKLGYNQGNIGFLCMYFVPFSDIICGYKYIFILL